MALEQRVFDALKALAPCRLLSLGMPDLLLTQEFDVRQADDAQAIANWHRWDGPVYDTEAVFKELGIEATYFDIHASRGVERIVDLNQDIDWPGPKFDVVLDPGTIEHVFNVAQAMWNCRKLANPGGRIIHCAPISAVNHGFWSFSPTALFDWYQHHGDIIERAEMLAGPISNRDVYELPPTQRFTPPARAAAFMVVKRGVAWGRGWPVQAKYRKFPNLKAPA